MQLHPKGKIFVVDAKIKEKMDKRSLNSRKKKNNIEVFVEEKQQKTPRDNSDTILCK